MLFLEERNDTWQNLLTGIGTARDKSSYGHLKSSGKLSPDYLEQLYNSDDMASRIVDIVPYEMLRQGFLIKDESFDLEIKTILLDALIKSRIYGASFIYLGVDDGIKQSEPLKLTKQKKLKFLEVICAKELFIKSFDERGKPNTYELLPARLIIHQSRLIPFYGSYSLSHKEYPASILQRLYPALQQFQMAWQSTSHLMSDAAQGVFKLKGLHSALASNRSEQILKRMELVDMSRSVSRSILLDAEDEDFRRDAYGFGGIPEILEKLMLRLSAAARIPVSLLMGQSPAGLNATGDSDIRFFYDQIKSEQEVLKTKIQRIYQVFCGDDKATCEIEFPALWQMSDKEQAEIRRLEAETDRIYLQEGVLLPEEIAQLRYPNVLTNKKERSELLADDEE